MFINIVQGFLLGLAYVAPIGMQNLYVINSAIKMTRINALKVALITIFFDVSLAVACFFGMGMILTTLPVLKKAIILLGGVVVIYIGIGLLKAEVKLDKSITVEQSFLKVASMCFSVTWFNPQAIIDGSLLLGGFRASLLPDYSAVFMAGVASASFIWFLFLSTIIGIFKDIINKKILGYINRLCGIVMCFFGVKLILGIF